MNNYLNERQYHVIVAGRNYGNLLAMARALGKVGYQAILLRIYDKKPNNLNPMNWIRIEKESKYTCAYKTIISQNKGMNVVDELIKINSSKRKMCLFPVDDYIANLIDANYDVLKDYYHLPNINKTKGAICALMDKNAQKALAVEFGLPVLSGKMVDVYNGGFTIPDKISYPCFVKPNVSIKGKKTAMKKCNNQQELEFFLSDFIHQDASFLVEEYADIEAEYSVLGLSVNDKVFAPALFKVLRSGNRERKGITIYGELVKLPKYEKIVKQCVEFIRSLGYTGLFDIDFLETKSGEIYFLEINFRMGASMHAFTQKGVNLPGAFTDEVMKNISISEECFECYEKADFVNEKVLIEELLTNDIDLKTAFHYLKVAEIPFIKDEEDKKPYLQFYLFIILVLLMRIPFRLVEWTKGKYRYLKETL